MKESGRSSQVRRLREHPIHRFSQHNAFPNGEGKEETASPPKKEANSASLRLAAPSKGRGSRGHSLLPMEGGAPKGRRLDGGSGMKESEEMHLKSTINESTLSTADAVSLPHAGNAVKLSGRTFLAPHLGSCPKG